MQHKGEIVEKAIRQSGYKLVKLAKELKRSRRWIYYAFENPNLSIDYVLRIGKIIQHDFHPEINELKYLQQNPDPSADENHPLHWKNKYQRLLEEHYGALRKIDELQQLLGRKD